MLPVFTAGVVLTRFLFSDGAWDRLKKHWFAVVLFLFLEAVIAILSILFIVTKFGVSRLAGRVLILFTVLLMCVLALVVLWTVFFPQPIHRIYLLVALTVGSIMLLLTEPYHVPDENTHYMKVYAFSNALLGIPTLQDNQYYISKVDFEYYLKQIDHVVSDFSIEGVEQFWSDMVQFEDDSVLIKTSWVPINSWIYEYGISPVILALCRYLHCGPALQFAITRFVNLLIGCVMVMFAIKMLPFGKMIPSVIALMPMSLHLMGSLSYDATVIPLFFLCFAFLLRFSNEGFDKNKTGLYILMFLLICILLPLKHYSNAPLLLSPMLPFLFRKDVKNRQKAAWICIAVAVGMVLLTLVIPRLIVGTRSVSGTLADTVEQTITGQKIYTTGYFLRHPGYVLFLIKNTLMAGQMDYIAGVIGNLLGWLSVPLDSEIIYAYMIFLTLSIIPEKQEVVVINPFSRIVFFICSCITIAALFLNFLLTFTYENSAFIIGVQGRYFIPSMFPILLSLVPSHIKATFRRNAVVYSGIIFCVMWMICFFVRG